MSGKTQGAIRRAAAAQKMRAAGYYTAAEIAEKMQIHIGSVYRWVSVGEVQATKVAGRDYISHGSLVAKIGANAARVFGFTPTAPATPAPATIVEVEDSE